MKLTRAERRRRKKQLTELAKARAGLREGTTVEDYLAVFNKHLDTSLACPDGHPEIAYSLMLMEKSDLDPEYICPACGQPPFGDFKALDWLD